MEENKDLNKNEEFDKADFADVNYSEEVEEKKEKKVKKVKDDKVPKDGKKVNGKLIAIIVSAVLALAVIVTAAVLFMGKTNKSNNTKSGGTTGVANAFNDSIGVTKDGYLYHSNFANDKVFKTKIDKEEFDQEKIMDATAFFMKDGEDIYFYDSINTVLKKYKESGKHTTVYEGVSYYHQFYGDYIYFLTHDSNYGGFIRRVSKDGGEAEIVLNVSTNCYGISGGVIAYYDPVINSLCAVPLNDAIAFSKESNGEGSTSGKLGAVCLSEKFAKYINFVGKDVYFVDATDGKNLLCKINIEEGTFEELNFGTTGTKLNIIGNYIFYVGEDNHLYRMNLDYKDMRDLTGNTFKEFGGYGIYGDDIVYYARMSQLNPETMRAENLDVIGVMSVEGVPEITIPVEEEPYMPEM